MTLWRPPRSPNERAMRAIRSMQNGSIDGRVVSAYPVKPEIVDEEGYDEYDDLDEETTDDGVAEDDSGIKPWTDYFNVKGASSVHTFALSKTPWDQPKMSSDTRGYSSVHLYWNGVYQRDMSYLLESSIITVLDPESKLRAGDTITVKYFFDQGASATVDENMYRMQCWLDSHETTPTNRPGYYIFWAGVLEAPPVGSNTGKITTTAGRYYSLQSTGNWNSKFRVPPGITIPTGDDVAGITWRITYDPGADVFIDTPSASQDFYVKGNDYGKVLCHKDCCGFGSNCPCEDGVLGLLRYDQTEKPFNPTFGPIGGQVFSSGADGIQLARTLNAWSKEPPRANGYQRGWFVNRAMPEYSPFVPYNTGCTYAGGIANAEDTIYGKMTYESATYDVKIGVTAYVIKK